MNFASTLTNLIVSALLASAAHTGINAATATAAVRVDELAVNHLVNPIGLGDGPIVFSWQIESDRRDARQTAYRIRVRERDAGKDSSPLWDSGVVQSDNSIAVRYEGPQLASRGRYTWTVDVWSNQTDDRSVTSDPRFFEMGLLRPDDWKAEWIGSQNEDASPEPQPAPLIRKAFDIEKKVVRARAYATGLGYFAMTVNGEPSSDHVLDPVVTQYDKRSKYLVYDIADKLRTGENVIAVTLGNGWFNQFTPSAWDFDTAPWRDTPRMIAQIELQYADGSRQTIASDETWRWKSGPITFNGIRNGVHYDANLETEGWEQPGFDARAWQPVSIVSAPTLNLQPQLMPPTRVVKQLDVAKQTDLSDTVTVYDFGTNTSGRCVIEVSGPPGETVTLRYGERILDDGHIDQKELSRFIREGDTQTDRYTIGPSGRGRFEPAFLYHGFQYIQAERTSPEITIDRIHANVVHTDLVKTGGFVCSNPLLNELYSVSLNSFLTNFHSYPTDCPHREKIGWTGDGQLMMDFGLFNFDSTLAYAKWLQDMADAQKPDGQVPGIAPTSGWGFVRGSNQPDPLRAGGYGPQWEGVSVSLPWRLYLTSGDITLLETQYPTMKGYFEFLTSWSENGILRIGIDDHKWVRLQTHAPVIASAYFYHLAGIMERAAIALEREDDAQRYQHHQTRIKAAFNSAFLDEATGTYDNGSQTSQALAIAFDLVPDAARDQVIDKLVESIEATDGHPIAGVVGVRALTDALPKIGRSDLLYAMVNKRTMPSWGWWLEQGATTLWQNWDGSQSRNHIMFGSINDFFYENLAGIQIDPEQPAYKHFYIKPTIIKDLDYVEAWHESPYGEIRSRWERREDSLRFTIKVPANSSATIFIPRENGDTVTESDRDVESSEGVEFLRKDGASLIYKLSSGTYTFDLAKDVNNSNRASHQR